MYFKRTIDLPGPTEASFFLWGARQTGKSSLLKDIFKDSLWIDLLHADQHQRYLTRPEILREELAQSAAKYDHVVIDEIQKVPALLDEVHWLIENSSTNFALCGSNAVKVRRAGVNLLGGRALRYRLRGLSAKELGSELNLERLLNRGYLPRIYQSGRWRSLLRSYSYDYLTTEIAAEGLTRNLAGFSNFLRIAAHSDTEIINYTNIAGECGTSVPTVKSYYRILEDSMLGDWVPAFRRKQKRRVSKLPKFYFSDVGIVNELTRRHIIEPRTEPFGKAFENWVHHELCCYLEYTELFKDVAYWRLSGGTEVDFIVGDMEFAVEAKASANITNQRLKALRSLVVDNPSVKKRVVVSLESRSRLTEDGIDILTVSDFIQQLWDGQIIS